MTINNNFFNKLATEAVDLTKTDCSSVWRQLQGNADTMIKNWPLGQSINALGIQNRVAIIYAAKILADFLKDLSTACARKGDPLREIDTATKRYERDLFCINAWNKGGAAIPKHHFWRKVMQWLSTGSGGLCAKIKQMQKVLSPTEQFIQDSMTPDSDLNNLEICPEGVVDGIINSLPPLYQDDIEQIRTILAICAAAIAAAALALMAAIAAGVPAFIANAAYATAVASARAVAIAALVALGLTTDDASAAADELENGIESCDDTVDPKPIDIGVEQGGCCFEGQSIDVPGGQNGCQDINGTWIDDLTQMGCMDLPQYEK